MGSAGLAPVFTPAARMHENRVMHPEKRAVVEDLAHLTAYLEQSAICVEMVGD